jgi:phosphoribosyl 1,2-cyclic phosphodiesterase
MKLKVVNTGSQGNCFLFEAEHQTLIVECGVPFAEIKKALDFDLKQIVGCVISHEHL